MSQGALAGPLPTPTDPSARTPQESSESGQPHAARQPLETQRIWTDFGNRDPLWYVLSTRGRRGGGWSVEEFFQTGKRSVDLALGRLGELSIPINYGVALDFGCGVGRLTQALADHFAQVYGVDVSPSMISNAERYNRHGTSCQFKVNPFEDLSQFQSESVDFVMSDVVLQHVRPELARRYVSEFIRVLRIGGVALFYLPGTLVQRGLAPWLVSSYNWLRYRERTTLSYGVDRSEVARLVEGRNSTIIEIRDGSWLDRGQRRAGPIPSFTERLWLKAYTTLTDRWEGAIYIARKGGGDHR
jgi:SAM-dependent methyltransferase